MPLKYLHISILFAIVMSMAQLVMNDRIIVKRQITGTAPTFGQSSYTFPLSSCNAGTNVGTISATSGTTTSGSGQIGYTIDPASVQGYNVIINYLTGVMTLATNAPTSITFNVRASNVVGTAVVPVTVTCSGSTNSLGTISCPFPVNGLCTSIATATTSLTYPYTNTLTNPYTYPYTTGTTYPYSSSSGCSSTTGTYPYTSTYPYTGTTGTTQTFTATNCFQGGLVGQVCYPGAAGYLVSGGQLTINANTGIITQLYPLTTGTTLSATVTAYTTAGTPVSIPITVTASCSGSTGITGTTGFSQSSYSFTATSCTPGSSVGSVYAPGATYYIITNGNTQFTISSTGLITVSSYLTAGTYTLLVSSYGTIGTTTSVPVTITVSCSTTGTTGVATFTQSSYTLSSSTCTAGSSVGSVTATNAITYSISSGSTSQFAISSTGLITLLTAVPAGTYSLTVTATGSLGSTSVPVTLTITCNGGTTGTGGPPVWNQNFYAFTLSQCVSTGQALAGTVSATNAASYAINYGSPQFSVDSSGNIYDSGPDVLTTGVYSLTVTATSSTGVQVAIPVTVNVICSG